MKTCKNCGKILEQEARFCDGCGYDTTKELYKKPMKKKNNLSKVVVALLLLGIIAVILFFTLKDTILLSYYIKKGDIGSSNIKSIDYYIKAIDIKYTEELVEKIKKEVSECRSFEEELIKLEKILNSKDLNSMYIENYVKKAEEHFENGDYDQTLKYLSKAKEYNFKQENFKYYNKLMEIQNQKINEHIKENNLHENNNEYIIYDSHIRYLTKSELYKYSKNELALIRNEIFARYGYIFNKDEYFNYFINTSWYIPNPNFNGSINELNTIERDNVELIKSLEQGY